MLNNSPERSDAPSSRNISSQLLGTLPFVTAMALAACHPAKPSHVLSPQDISKVAFFENGKKVDAHSYSGCTVQYGHTGKIDIFTAWVSCPDGRKFPAEAKCLNEDGHLMQKRDGGSPFFTSENLCSFPGALSDSTLRVDIEK